MTDDFEEILALIKSTLKLDRDRGLEFLSKKLLHFENNEEKNDKIENLQTKILEFIASESDTKWETRQGGLQAAKLIITMKLSDANLNERVQKHALCLMHDNEARVRQSAGGYCTS